MRGTPPGFMDMVQIILKDWNGPSPYDRLNVPCGHPGPRLSKEDQIRWFKHIIKVGERELPSLKSTNPSASHCLQLLFDMAKDTYRMTDTKQYVWTLTRTEYYGQCTGFAEEKILLCIFAKKPDLKTLAPFLGKSLSSDMGEAIAQVQNLIDKETETFGGYDFELNRVEIGVLLHKDN